jgi:hypothetical protein
MLSRSSALFMKMTAWVLARKSYGILKVMN